jgi:hypothetical protein
MQRKAKDISNLTAEQIRAAVRPVAKPDNEQVLGFTGSRCRVAISLGRQCYHEGLWAELANPNVPQKEAVPNGLLYDSRTQSYWQVNGFDQWIRVNESQAKRSLMFNNHLKKDDVDITLNDITTYCSVEFAGPIAGYTVGVYNPARNTRVLVTTSPEFIEPVPGDWNLIRKLLEQQLGQEQLPYMLGWLKTAISSVRTHRYFPGQALVLAGPAGAGKTLFQDYIITPLLGGRDAKPYQYMAGKTEFNADLFMGEHLIVADENPHPTQFHRRNFGTKIKDLVVNQRQKLHPKGRDGFMLSPFWRLTISVNDEAESLLILPPIDPSIEDKLMLWKVGIPDCLPESDGREEFIAQIKSELPAFVAHLEDFVIPEKLRSNRYGVTHFHNPDLVRALDEFASEIQLLNLIDIELWRDDRLEPITEWEGTAGELYRRLTGEGSTVWRHIKDEVHNAQTCGRYLSSLVRKRQRVQARTLDGNTIYTITKESGVDPSKEVDQVE